METVPVSKRCTFYVTDDELESLRGKHKTLHSQLYAVKRGSLKVGHVLLSLVIYYQKYFSVVSGGNI